MVTRLRGHDMFFHVHFLTRYNLFDKDNLPESLKNTGLKKALTVLEVMNFSEDEKEGYEDHLKWLRIQTNTIKKYEQNAREEGFSESKAEGEAIGEARGKAEGEEKLKKERRDIAKNLLKQGISTEIVMSSTGLTRREVEEILGSHLR